MSANNVVVIIKKPDGRFYGYHRDMDMYCDGYYKDGASCFCLEEEDEYSPFQNKVWIPDKECSHCGGTGKVDSSREKPDFEASTCEEAVHKYYEWLQRKNDKCLDDMGFPFVIEYGIRFEGV